MPSSIVHSASVVASVLDFQANCGTREFHVVFQACYSAWAEHLCQENGAIGGALSSSRNRLGEAMSLGPVGRDAARERVRALFQVQIADPN